MSNKLSIIVALFVSLLAGAQSTSAGTLYALTWDNQIQTRSAVDGSLISSAALPELPQALLLLSDSVNHLLYGFFNTYPGVAIGVINPVSGDVTQLVALENQTAYYSFDGAGNLYGISGGPEMGVSLIDKTTGAFTSVGTLGALHFRGFATGTGNGGVLAAGVDGESIYTANLLTATASLFGSLTDPDYIFDEQFGYNPGAGDAFFVQTIADGSGSGIGSGIQTIYRLNSGGDLSVLAEAPHVQSVAYLPDAEEFAPEPSSIMLLGLGTVGLIALRKYLR